MNATCDYCGSDIIEIVHMQNSVYVEICHDCGEKSVLLMVDGVLHTPKQIEDKIRQSEEYVR